MSDTIAALATASVPSAIGVLRLSGERALEIAESVFQAESGRPLSAAANRRLVYGTLFDQEGAPIDKVLATISRGPGSYTGEDTAEFQCHGSPGVLWLGLEALFAAGARQAGAGEFTKRAFLNGKLDLVQAEAVADLIDAESQAAVRQAAGQLSGALSRRVKHIYDGLVDVLAHFHAVLDYPDEDIDPFRADTLQQALTRAQAQLDTLLESYRRGRYIAGGVPCAIVGRPNVGKSSLLNLLVGFDRAIVTNVPGTTRDTVEERCQMGEVLLRLIDTAGIRDTDDIVERMGVERSRSALKGAELALVLIDRSQEITQEDLSILNQAMETAAHSIVIWTKSDLPAAGGILKLPLDPRKKLPVVAVSAVTGEGISELEMAVRTLFPGSDSKTAGEMLSNARHYEAARRARDGVRQAAESLQMGMTPDAVLVDVEAALLALGELTGQSIREDVTNRIFERFCVGK